MLINYILILFVVAILITLIVIVYINFRRHNKNLQDEIGIVKEKNERILLSTQLEIQEQTFNHISREIHDHVGQRLTLARFYLSNIVEKSSSDVKHISDDASHLIGEAITDLKQLSRTLTSTMIEDNGLIFALEHEVQRISRLVQWKIRLSVEGETEFMPVQNELIIFRIVQEALQNIIKYAFPSKVEIEICYHAGLLKLFIKDDGCGFEPETTKKASSDSRSGLANMRSRAALLNGIMQIESSPQQGTILYFQFPLNYTYG